MSKDTFHSFDALRSISFLIVFFSHLPYDILPKSVLNLIADRGYIGVEFFFTLSGFLITYILLNEKKQHKKINLKNFFIRRILRIWPLFYLMILFAMASPFIINFLGLEYSNEGYSPNYLMTSLFLENYQTIFLHKFPNVMPLPVFWSLCVEEHFYIIWGLLLYKISMKKVPYLMVLFLILPNFFRAYFLEHNLLFLDLSTNFDFFMFGAIPAYLYVNQKEKMVQAILKIPNLVKLIILLVTMVFIFASGSINYRGSVLMEPVILGILFSCSLMIFIPEKNLFKISPGHLLSRLGVYTYGLYLTHFIAISFTKKLLLKLHFEGNILFSTLILSALTITILASILSFYGIEKPFLRLKSRFS